MRYLTFPTQEAAEAVSRRVAKARGCEGVTEFWHSCHTSDDGECLMTVAKGDETDLSDLEIKNLSDTKPRKFEPKKDIV